MQVVSKYEVECPSCGVKYPPGQKRCVHCGGRTAQSVVEMPDASPEFADAVGKVHREPEPMAMGDGREIVFMPRDAETADENASGGWLRRLGGLTWVVLFVLLTAIRMCSEGGQ
jgi:hypothetical protein